MRTGWLFITDFGDTAVTLPLALLTFAFLAGARQTRTALCWGFAVIGCAAAIGVAKILLTACGPGQLAEIGRLRSPSGHAGMSVVVYGGLILLIGRGAAPRRRRLLNASVALLLLAIAVSRPVLLTHSTVEVLLGLAIGGAALGSLAGVLRRWPPQQLPTVWLAVSAALLVALLHGTRWPAERAVRGAAGLFHAAFSWCN